MVNLDFFRLCGLKALQVKYITLINIFLCHQTFQKKKKLKGKETSSVIYSEGMLTCALNS